MRESVALVEAALALGIRHFDTAPSYGLGASEDVLGVSLSGCRDVTIATKVGIGRRKGALLKSWARRIAKPMMGAVPGLRSRLGRLTASSGPSQFRREAMRASVLESLRRLGRESVTAILLHELSLPALGVGALDEVASWLDVGFSSAVGSGTGAGGANLVGFGEIAQYRWEPSYHARTSKWRIQHGILRRPVPAAPCNSEQASAFRELGRESRDPGAWPGVALTLALAEDPHTIVLISSTKVDRLKSMAARIDWSMIERRSPEDIALMRTSLGL